MLRMFRVYWSRPFKVDDVFRKRTWANFFLSPHFSIPVKCMDHTKKAFFFGGKILRVVGDDTQQWNSQNLWSQLSRWGCWEPNMGTHRRRGADCWTGFGTKSVEFWEEKNMGYEANTQPKLVECVCGNFCSSITILRSVEGLQEKGRCSLDIPFYQHSWLCDYHPRGFLCKSTLEKGPIKCRPTLWFLADGHYGLHRWRARRHFLHSERCTPRRWTEQTRGSWKRATWHWPFSHNSPFRYHLLRYVGCQKSETVPID